LTDCGIVCFIIAQIEELLERLKDCKMQREILFGYIFSYGYLFLIIFGVGILQRLFEISIEISRKIIHILIGFTWLFLYKYLAGTVHFIIIPFSFVIINYFSYKFNLFKMIERQDENKNHFGTVYYAIAMTIMSIISTSDSDFLVPYGISVFVLSFGDGFAAILGSHIKKHNVIITKEKSLVGTISCIAFSAIGIYLFSFILNTKISFPMIVLTAILSGIFELVGHGLDNFTVTLGVMIFAKFMLNK